MKQSILIFFLEWGLISTTSLYSNQKKMALTQKNSITDQIDNQQIYDTHDNDTSPIICDENDKEVCEYIEQQEESNFSTWLRELEIILFLKLIYFKECLDKYKETFDAWLKKLPPR